MSFKQMLLVLSLFIVNVFFTFKVTAQEDILVEGVVDKNVLTKKDQSKVHMLITPSVCVVKTRGEHCQMAATISWQANVMINACLYKNDGLIKCWTKARNIKEKLMLSLTQNMIFTLQNKSKVLTKQYIKVNTSTSIKYRRRLRSQWSLF